MKYKRIGRTLICLLLVCVLLLNVSPIRAEASVLGGIVTVETAKAVGSMLLGLGIGVGVTATAFELLTSDAASELGLSDTMSIYSFGDGRYGVEGSRLQRLFDWLFSSGTIKTDSAGTSYTLYNPMFSGNSTYAYSSNVPFAPCWFYYNYAGQHYICEMFVALEECTITRTKISGTSSGWTTKTLSSRYNGYYVSGSTGSRANYDMTGAQGIYLGEFEQDYYDWLNKGIRNEFDYACKYLSDKFGFSSAPSTDYDLTLNFIAEPGISLATGYPAWHQNSVSIPNVETGANEVYYPIVIGGTLEETQNKTQEEVWTGEGSVVDSPPTTEPDVGIDTEGLTQAGLDASLSLFGYELGAKLGAWFEEQFGLISALTVIVEGIYELIKPIADWFSTIISGIGDILETLVAGIPAIIDAITAIPAAIADVITDALVWAFAPSETFIASKVDALIAKYPSSQNLFTLGDQLKSFFLSLGQTPPVINIDLGAFEGSFYLGGTVAFLDLTWYSRYKPIMDAILGGFLWLWFAWRMWLKLPGILEGASGEVGRLIVRRESNNDN